MDTIWEFPLEFAPRQAITMPKGAKLLTVQTQQDTICIWAIVSPAAPQETRVFIIVGTGDDLDDGTGEYLGTVQQGPYVWHLFEEIRVQQEEEIRVQQEIDSALGPF